MPRRPPQRRRAVTPTPPSMWWRMIQSWRDNPIKWLSSVFGLIAAVAVAWPIVANWEPIVRWRMADYFSEQMTPFVGLTQKLYLGSLYERCDKALAEIKKSDDPAKNSRQIRHLDTEIKTAEKKANVSEYGGCQQ